MWLYVQLEKHSWNVLSKRREEGRGSLGDEDLGKAACPVSSLIKDTERHRWFAICSAFYTLVFKVWSEINKIFRKSKTFQLTSKEDLTYTLTQQLMKFLPQLNEKKYANNKAMLRIILQDEGKKTKRPQTKSWKTVVWTMA